MSTAIVILNWNGKHLLERFVPILFKRTNTISPRIGAASRKGKATIFVADNGSTDGSVEWCEKYFRDGKGGLIKLDENYGFTGGYNRAFTELKAKYGHYDYYLLLNSDIEVGEGWFDHLQSFMDEHQEVAICSPKVLSYNCRDTFEHAGACGGMIDRFYFPWCRGRILSYIEKDNGQYDAPAEVFWASGTSFMIRSEVWHRLGGLDEAFFAHMEEIDLCWRAKLAGWKVWVVPLSVVYHIGGGTLPNDSPQKLYLNFRNNLLMMYKNLPPLTRWFILLERMTIDIAIASIFRAKGKNEFCESVFKAHRDYRKMKSSVQVSKRTRWVPRPFSLLALKALGAKKG